jgi:3-oxoacyl-[acyl-carrier-protein] synthase-3
MHLCANSTVGRDVAIFASSSYLPDQVIVNESLFPSSVPGRDWIYIKTGIRERRRMAASEATSDLCIAAGREVLISSGTAPAQIDALVIGTNTPDYPFPSTALIVAEALGMPDVLTLDLNQYGCPASLFGLFFGAQFFMDAACRNVLVIAAEAMSRIFNPEKPESSFFGDGAGAFLLRRHRSPDAGFLGWDLRGKASMDLAIRNGGSRSPLTLETLAEGGQYLYMNGRAVWDKATTLMRESLQCLLRAKGLDLSSVDLFLFHQANVRMIEFCMSELGLPMELTHCVAEKYGNTSAATLPIVYHDAVLRQKIQPGRTIAFASAGAGFYWGSTLYRHAAPEDF